jgi:hypothetical protein
MQSMKLALLVLSLACCGSALAVPVTINYTADNAIFRGGICANPGCAPLTNDGQLTSIFANGSEANAGDWTQADSVVLDLAPGTYDIAFVADNFGVGSAGNPAGLLAEILWQGISNLTSSAWDVTTNGVSYVSATEWAKNGTGIWGGALLGEISSDAYWIWTASNFNMEMPSRVGFRTSITVAATSVPEPTTLSLLSAALLVGLARRRRRAV